MAHHVRLQPKHAAATTGRHVHDGSSDLVDDHHLQHASIMAVLWHALCAPNHRLVVVRPSRWCCVDSKL
jgi:hypothetical protein